MARKLRIQYPGAIFHLINRGNYTREIFEDDGANRAFEACLLETSERFKWKIHAFSLMCNHFHIVAEIESPNLPEGMQWLQVTYALRFNRFRNEQGHLFQGRYKSIPVERGIHLVRLVNYVHLNPVEAHLVEPEQMTKYRWSSLYHFTQKQAPAVLTSVDWIAELAESGVTDMSEYVDYLQILARDREEQRVQGWSGMNHGWAIGTQGWKEALAREYAHLSLSGMADARESAEFKRLQWESVLEELLKKAGKGPADVARDRKGSVWKVAIALELRLSTTASCAWIARKLNAGKASSLRQYISALRHQTMG